MEASTSQAQSSKTVIVCTLGNATLFSQERLTRISPIITRVTGGENLLRELGVLRPIGVLLVLADPELADGKPWLRILERMVMFEGLRVVVAIQNDGSNPVKVLSSRIPGQFHLAQCLGVRDFLVYDAHTTDFDLDAMVERIRFAFGISSNPPFEGCFKGFCGAEESIEISLPARISHVDDSLHFVIESGVFLEPGSRVRVRLMGLGVDAQEVGATMIENLPSGLRFNFGNSLRLRLDDEDVDSLQRLIASEQPGKVFDRPVRRAMVVTRSLSLRQRLISALAQWQIESRVPLVRRNIRGDLPPLQPDFLVIEPSLLNGSNAFEGSAEIDEYLKLAGPRCKSIVVGRRTDWNFQPSDRMNVIRDSANLADDLKEVIERLSGQVGSVAESELGRHDSRWFATDAPSAKIFLILTERSTAVSESGMEIETAQVLRLWTNVEVRSFDSKVHFIGRVYRSLRLEDSFRALLRIGGREKPLFRFQIAGIATSPGLQRYFRSLALAALPATGSSQAANPVAGTPRPVATEAQRIKPREQASTKSRHGAIKPDPAEDFGRGDDANESFLSAKSLWIAVAFIVVLGLLVTVTILVGSSSDQVYRDSFEKLFESMGRGRRGP